MVNDVRTLVPYGSSTLAIPTSLSILSSTTPGPRAVPVRSDGGPRRAATRRFRERAAQATGGPHPFDGASRIARIRGRS